MSGIIYINGDYLPAAEARVSVYDRGFLMADAVYEVTCVLDGKLIDYGGHLARLKRSLAEVDLPLPLDDDALLAAHRRLIADNALQIGMIYVQVTRGDPGTRDFLYPDPEEVPPTVVMFAVEAPASIADPAAQQGLGIVTMPDQRWARRDIKTVQLLYPSRARTLAKRAGADDAWMVQDGLVTEGTASNAWIVADGRLVTRALSPDILAGVTRAALRRLAEETGLGVDERAFTVAEAQAADEAFITGATQFAVPVVRIDGQPVGSGRPGPVARRLHGLYLEAMRAQAI